MDLKDQHDAIFADSIWDDNLLTKAYNESICYANEALARRLACSTNKSEVSICSSQNQFPQSFQKGDYVRATYMDGMDYEAKIISLSDNGICLIKFIGYNNIQEVHLTDLVGSWGKRARRLQFSQAKVRSQTGNDTEKKCFNHWKKSFICPPKPPLPFTAKYETCEGLSAMLMAWYMSGYYTGLYESQRKN